MTDNSLYLDEQGYPCDDYRDIHEEAIEETTKMLLSMTKRRTNKLVSQKPISVSYKL